MGTIVKKNVVKREANKIYYIDGAGNACLANRGKAKKAAKKK